jgi:uncharacterized protein
VVAIWRAVSINVRERLRMVLPGALKQRDRAVVAVLRATLAALDNVEAVAPADDREGLALQETPVGVGVREVVRRELSDEDTELLVRAEIDERQIAARVYEQAGEHERARRLRLEADALTAVAGLPQATDTPPDDRTQRLRPPTSPQPSSVGLINVTPTDLKPHTSCTPGLPSHRLGSGRGANDDAPLGRGLLKAGAPLGESSLSHR